MAEQDRKWLWVLLAIFGIGALIGIVAMAGGLTPTPTPGRKCRLKIRYDYTGQNKGTIKVDLTIREKTTNSVVKEWDAVDCDYTPNKRTVEYDIDKGTYILWMSYPSRTTGFVPQLELPIEFSITDTDLGAEKTVDIELNIPPPPAQKTLTIQMIDGRDTDNLPNLAESDITLEVVISDPSGNTQTLIKLTDTDGKAQFDIPNGYCVDSIVAYKSVPGVTAKTFVVCNANQDPTKGLTMNSDRTLYIPFRSTPYGNYVGNALFQTYNNETPAGGISIGFGDPNQGEGCTKTTAMYDTRFAGALSDFEDCIPDVQFNDELYAYRFDYSDKSWMLLYVGGGLADDFWYVFIMDKPVANEPTIG